MKLALAWTILIVFTLAVVGVVTFMSWLCPEFFWGVTGGAGIIAVVIAVHWAAAEVGRRRRL